MPVLLDAPHGAIFMFKSSWRERNWPLGPRIGDSKWDLEYPYRTWEINWPQPLLPPLVGFLEPEIQEYVAAYPGCHYDIGACE